MAAELLSAFAAELKGLVRAEKKDINALSMIAGDNKQFAQGLVTVIENHVLTCPAPQKLPALYLLDSIVKNVGEPYTALFAVRLPEVFGAVWSSTLQDRRASLSRLFNTWVTPKPVFPAATLDAVKARMVSTSGTTGGGSSSSSQRAAGPMAVPVQLPQGVLLQRPVGLPSGAVLLQPQAVPFPGFTVVQGPGGSFLAQPGAAMPLVTASLPVPSIQLLQQLPNQHLVQVMQQPILLQQQQQQQPQHHQHHGLPGAATGPGLASGAPPSPPAAQWGGYSQPMQQQQQQQQRPMQRRSPSPLPLASAPAAGAARPHTSSPSPNAGAMVSNQLDKLLSSLARNGLLAAGAAGAAAAGGSTPPPEDDPAIQATTLSASFIKDYHPGVVRQLITASAKTRQSFLDLAFHRKRRRAAGGDACRQWYVSVDDWVAGTLAPTEAPPDFFDEEEAKQPEPEQQHQEREDPTQTACAISGERFDKTYDAEQDDWFYKDARRIYGEEAERYGVADGAIVKVKCLAEARGVLLGGGTGGTGEETADGAAELEADLAAAAAAAEAGGGGGAAAAAAAAAGAAGDGDATAAAAGEEAAELGLEGEEKMASAATGDGLKEEEDSKAAAALGVVKEEPMEVGEQQEQDGKDPGLLKAEPGGGDDVKLGEQQQHQKEVEAKQQLTGNGAAGDASREQQQQQEEQDGSPGDGMVVVGPTLGGPSPAAGEEGEHGVKREASLGEEELREQGEAKRLRLSPVQS